jgi:hypothetical protein
MSVDTFTLEFGRWTKEIELNRNPDNDFDPQQIVEWDIEGPRFLNPDWSDLTDEQVLKEANVVYGKFGYEKAPVRLVALLTGRSGLHKFEQPFDALVDPTISSLDGIVESGSWIDAKSHFQEMTQEKEGVTPHYELLSESGPDHEKVFMIGVYVGDRLCGKGEGNSKQAGQQAAATEALKSYKGK